MPVRPALPNPLPVLACLALTLAGACLPGARREPRAPVERPVEGAPAEAPPSEVTAPPPPALVSPPEPEIRRLACVPRPTPSAESQQAPPPSEKAWLLMQLYERPAIPGSPKSLQLRLSTTRMYSCLGYRVPARLSTAPGELRLDVGDVTEIPGPCPAALGPAVGDVTLPEAARGTFTLRLRHKGQEDQYRLVLEEARLELTPLRARFSASQNPPVLLRAPEGALHLQCIFKDWENPCHERAAAGGPTCETFFADPVIARLEPLELKPGTYSLGFFNSPQGCDVRAPEGVEALARYLSEHYRDPSNCLYITVHTWQGGGLANL